VAFRDRLVATIRAARAVLEAEGVLVVGSEVPNLLEPGAAATLIVSQDLNIGVPVDRHAQVKRRLSGLHAFAPSADEPSVWTPRSPDLLELNFVGMDPTQDPAEAYVLEDDRLPLLVFGALSLVSPGAPIDVEGARVTLPRPAGRHRPGEADVQVPGAGLPADRRRRRGGEEDAGLILAASRSRHCSTLTFMLDGCCPDR
jgi:hypothetical protein